MLRTGVLSEAEWDAVLRPEWERLFSQSATASPFQSHAWVSTWWSHMGRGRRPAVLWAREGDDLVGLWPLCTRPGAWTALRPMGAGASDYLHPLVRTGYEASAGGALATLACDQPYGVLDLHQVREDMPGAPPESSDAVVAEQAKCLVLDLPSTYDAYIAGLSKSLRYDVRRLDREAERTSIVPAEEFGVQRALDVFFECHRQRWRKRGLPGAFVGERSVRFHREWAERASAEGLLWLSVLEVDGEPCGALYAMRSGSTCYFYQSGFSPRAQSVSPGTLLVASTLRRAIDEGLTRFDFLRGDEPYKRRWKPQHALANYRYIVPLGGAAAKAGVWWNRMGQKVETKVRRRLEGRGLI